MAPVKAVTVPQRPTTSLSSSASVGACHLNLGMHKRTSKRWNTQGKSLNKLATRLCVLMHGQALEPIGQEISEMQWCEAFLKKALKCCVVACLKRRTVVA